MVCLHFQRLVEIVGEAEVFLFHFLTRQLYYYALQPNAIALAVMTSVEAILKRPGK